MMGSITVLGGALVIGMALIYDADGTIRLVTVALTVRGITWLVKKITAGISLDASQIIDFANAIGSASAIGAYVGKIGATFAKISEFADKIVFWN
jgi:cystathionine beta-lyase family protein involved in aluminum resistance